MVAPLIPVVSMEEIQRNVIFVEVKKKICTRPCLRFNLLVSHKPSISCSFLNVLLICCVFDLCLPFQFDPKPLGGRLANKTE